MKIQDDQNFIRDYFAGTLAAQVAALDALEGLLPKAASRIAGAIRKGGQWLLFGNGGSAADAQHLAAEMVGRLYTLERRGLPALALTTDSSALTCVGNDYGFERVFERQVEALARRGDVVMGISTSGSSPNILRAFQMAKKKGCFTIALGGKDGGKMKKLAALSLVVPASRTSHIQEAHIAVGHCLCFLVERELQRSGFLKKKK